MPIAGAYGALAASNATKRAGVNLESPALCVAKSIRNVRFLAVATKHGPRVRKVPACTDAKMTVVIDEESDESEIEVTEEKVASGSRDITNFPIRALPIRPPKDKGQGRANDNEIIVLEAENKRLRAEIDDLRSALSEARQFLRTHQGDLIAQSNRSYELSRDCSRAVEDISKRL
ncbi:hypothetical protein BDR04DRAFT_1143236 [Suillus decipiens]|nr:hypothetical protein BDR04DRAFT_1143236 [Suillus decipiens]